MLYGYHRSFAVAEDTGVLPDCCFKNISSKKNKNVISPNVIANLGLIILVKLNNFA